MANKYVSHVFSLQFSQFFRVYGLATFPAKYDKSGYVVRKYCPELANFPDKYLYAPHTAPLDVQKKAGCIIGQDYPFPILDEKAEKQHCLDRCKAAYDQKFYGNSKEVLNGSAEGILRKRHGVPHPQNFDAKKRGKDGKIPDWAKLGHEEKTGNEVDAGQKATSQDAKPAAGADEDAQDGEDDIKPHETDQADEDGPEQEDDGPTDKKRKEQGDDSQSKTKAKGGKGDTAGNKKQKTKK